MVDLSRLRRVRPTLAGGLNLIGIIVIINLVVVLAQTISHNYELGQQVTTLDQQITQLQDQRDALAYSIQYYKTDSFKQREARAKLGLQLPGENVVALPSQAESPAPAVETPTRATKKLSNLQQWLQFLSGRPTAGS